MKKWVFNERKLKKVLIIIFTLASFNVCFSLLILVAILMARKRRVVGEVLEEGEFFEYRYRQFNPFTLDTTVGFVRQREELIDNEHVSFPDEDDNYFLLSSFDENEYKCHGTCVCSCSDYENSRKSGTFLSRTVFSEKMMLLVASVTSFVALTMAKDEMEDFCDGKCDKNCPLPDSNLEGVTCEELMKDESEDPDYYKDYRYFLCKGYCFPANNIREQLVEEMKDQGFKNPYIDEKGLSELNKRKKKKFRCGQHFLEKKLYLQYLDVDFFGDSMKQAEQTFLYVELREYCWKIGEKEISVNPLEDAYGEIDVAIDFCQPGLVVKKGVEKYIEPIVWENPTIKCREWDDIDEVNEQGTYTHRSDPELDDEDLFGVIDDDYDYTDEDLGKKYTLEELDKLLDEEAEKLEKEGFEKFPIEIGAE